MRRPERLLTSVDDGPADTAARALVARRAVIGVVAGALAMLLVTGGMAAAGSDLAFLGLASSPGPAAGPDGPAAAADGQEPALTTEPGACLSWARDDAADVVALGCARPHLFEVVGPVDAPRPSGSPFPEDAEWQQLVADRCAPLAVAYLGGRLDPVGRFRPGALKPSRTAWDAGDRTVRCGLQAPGRTGALFTSTGRVGDADQAAVFPAGTCLGLAAKEVSDPVDCATPHAAEVMGSADLGARFPGALPSQEDQDNYLQPTCTTAAEQFVGGPQKLADSKLTVYWKNLAGPSWDAGTRRVSCNLGTLLPDGSGFAPLTGRAATGVVIGGPEVVVGVPSARPGAPAEVPGSVQGASPTGPLDAASPDAGTPVAPGAPADPAPGETPTVAPTTPPAGSSAPG